MVFCDVVASFVCQGRVYADIKQDDGTVCSGAVSQDGSELSAIPDKVTLTGSPKISIHFCLVDVHHIFCNITSFLSDLTFEMQ